MTAEDILNVARGEIGVTESPKGSNKVKYNTAYYGRAVSGAKYPWCCAFLWWVFNKAGAAHLFYGGKKTAYCPEAMRYHVAEGHKVTGKIMPGDIVFYNFSGGSSPTHVGIAEEVSDYGITAIEGNTSRGNDENGGAVMRRERLLSHVVCAVRPAYDKAQDPTVQNMLADGVITEENVRNWELFLSGQVPCPAEYVRTIFDRYHKAKG